MAIMGNACSTPEMTSSCFLPSLLTVAGLFAGAILQPAAASAPNLPLPSSPEITATAPAVSARAGRGVLAGWDSNPWIPVGAVLLTVAAAPLIRRHLG